MSSKLEQKYQAHKEKSECSRVPFVTNNFVRKLFALETNDFQYYAQNVLSFVKEFATDPMPELSFLYIDNVSRYDWRSNLYGETCMSRILIQHQGEYCVISIQNNEANTAPCLIVHYGPEEVADSAAQSIKEHIPNLRFEPRNTQFNYRGAFWEAVYNSTNRGKSEIEKDMRDVMRRIFAMKLACIGKKALKAFIEESITDEVIDFCIMYDVLKYMEFSVDMLNWTSEYLNVPLDKLMALFSCADDKKQERFDSISNIETIASDTTLNLEGLEHQENDEFSMFIQQVAQIIAAKKYSVLEIFIWSRLNCGDPKSDRRMTMAMVCWAFRYVTGSLPTLYELYGTYILCYVPKPQEKLRKVAMLINHESRNHVVALSAAVLALSGQGVNVITPKLQWADYMLKKYDTFHKILALSAECLTESGSDILYDAIDTFMQKTKSFQHSVTIIDDYDIVMLDMAQYASYTYDEINFSNAIRQIYNAYQQNGIVTDEDLESAANGTNEPETFIELFHDCNETLNSLKKGEWVENEHYIVEIVDANQKIIHLINELILYDGVVFPKGLQQFIELLHGIEKLSPLHRKREEITVGRYLDRFEQVLGVSTRLTESDLSNDLIKDDLFVDAMPREEMKPIEKKIIVSNICVNAQKAKTIARSHERVIVLVQTSCVRNKLENLIKEENIEIITMDELANRRLEGNAVIYFFTYDCRKFEHAVEENGQVYLEQSVFVEVKLEQINHFNNLWGIYLQNIMPLGKELRNLWRGIEFCKYLRWSSVSNEKWWEHVKNKLVEMVETIDNPLYILCEWSVLNYECFTGEMSKKDIQVMRLEDIPHDQSVQHPVMILVAPLETNMAKVPQDAHVVVIINQPSYNVPIMADETNLLLHNNPLGNIVAPNDANFEALICKIGQTNSKCVQLPPISNSMLYGLSQSHKDICPITCDKSFYWYTIVNLFIDQQRGLEFNTILMVFNSLTEVKTIQKYITYYDFNETIENDIRISKSNKTLILLPKWKLDACQSHLYQELANTKILVVLTFLPRNDRFAQRYSEFAEQTYCVLNAEKLKDYISDYEHPNLQQIFNRNIDY